MGSGTETAKRDCAAPSRPMTCDVCEVRENSICADLEPREFIQVEKIMARRHVDRGRAIMAEGEPNDTLYIIVGGSFRLSKMLEDGRRQVTGFLFPGDFAGVRSTDASAYTAEALEDSTVCYFPHRFLDEIAHQAPGVKDRLIARGQTEYHKAQDHIVLLGKKSAEERVISFLQQIGGMIGVQEERGQRVPLPMPRQDIADYLGLRLETLSRTLASLKKEGRIDEVSRRDVLLTN